MEIPKIIQDIYDTFIEYYKEPFVDLQRVSDIRYKILIHWPEVIVTNEQGQSVIIWDLYCKIVLYSNGRLEDKMQFLRSKYNDAQWYSGYVHSHVTPLYHAPKKEGWLDCCTGSGPINHTLAKLRCLFYSDQGMDYSNQKLYEDMNVWRLFCWELDKYVHIESLAGGPYRRLVNIGTREVPIEFPIIRVLAKSTTIVIDPFISYLIKRNVLKYSYKKGKYGLGMSNREALFVISREFIHWVNEDNTLNLQKHPIQWFQANDILIYLSIGSFGMLTDAYKSNVMPPLENYLNHTLTTFKGADVVITKNETKSDIKTYLLLTLDALGYIIFKIFNHINTHYGKESIIKPSVNDNLPSKACPTTYQAAYIF